MQLLCKHKSILLPFFFFFFFFFYSHKMFAIVVVVVVVVKRLERKFEIFNRKFDFKLLCYYS